MKIKFFDDVDRFVLLQRHFIPVHVNGRGRK